MFSLFSASSIVSYATRIRYMNMFCLYLSLLLSLTPDLGWLSWLLQAIQLRMGIFMPQQYAQLLRLRFAILILLSVSCIVIECNQKAIETKRKKMNFESDHDTSNFRKLPMVVHSPNKILRPTITIYGQKTRQSMIQNQHPHLPKAMQNGDYLWDFFLPCN